MISSRADFFFFSPLESELEDGSFLLTEEDAAAAALRALAPRAELKQNTKTRMKTESLTNIMMLLTWRALYLDLEGPATQDEAPRLKATVRQRHVEVSGKKTLANSQI